MTAKRRAIYASISAILILSLAAGIYFLSKQQKGAESSSISYTMLRREPEELAAYAQFVVRGNVQSVSGPKWNTDDGKAPEVLGDPYMIYQENVIAITGVYKGAISTGDEIIVRTYGSEEAGGISTGGAWGTFNKGQEVILFLENDLTQYNRKQSMDYFILSGMLQGEYTVSGEYASTPESQSYPVDELLSLIDKHKYDEIDTTGLNIPSEYAWRFENNPPEGVKTDGIAN